MANPNRQPDGDMYAVMVLRQFATRITEALTRPSGASRVDHTDGEVHPDGAAGWTCLGGDNGNAKWCVGNSLEVPDALVGRHRVLTVETPTVEGARRRRRGYVLLIVRDALTSPANISPVGRQQISWAAKLTGRWSPQHGDNTISNASLHIFEDIRSNLPSFLLEEHTLRVDTYPKGMAAEFCRGFQTAAARNLNDSFDATDPSDPFDGPILLARSARKAEWILTAVRVGAASESIFFWGMSTSHDYWDDLNSRMNSAGKQDMNVVPMDPTNGADTFPSDGTNPSSSLSPFTPVSRAYYKLAQVCDELLPLDSIMKSLVAGDATAVDFGSSPGGWTQVLVNGFGAKRVLSFDPARLADRVKSLAGVWHVSADLTSDEALDALAAFAPLSIVVCDASIDFHQVFPTMVSTLDQLAQRLEERHAERPSLLTVPALLVVTLKLPYKTPNSLSKNLDRALQELPHQLEALRQIALAGSTRSQPERGCDHGHCTWWYRVTHLMANSDSERTVVAILR